MHDLAAGYNCMNFCFFEKFFTVSFFNNSDLGEIGFPSYLMMILYQDSEFIFVFKCKYGVFFVLKCFLYVQISLFFLDAREVDYCRHTLSNNLSMVWFQTCPWYGFKPVHGMVSIIHVLTAHVLATGSIHLGLIKVHIVFQMFQFFSCCWVL